VASGEDRIADVRARVERSRFHAWMGMHLERLGEGESQLVLEVGS